MTMYGEIIPRPDLASDQYKELAEAINRWLTYAVQMEFCKRRDRPHPCGLAREVQGFDTAPGAFRWLASSDPTKPCCEKAGALAAAGHHQRATRHLHHVASGERSRIQYQRYVKSRRPGAGDLCQDALIVECCRSVAVDHVIGPNIK